MSFNKAKQSHDCQCLIKILKNEKTSSISFIFRLFLLCEKDDDHDHDECHECHLELD